MKIDSIASAAQSLSKAYRSIGGQRAYLNPRLAGRIEAIRAGATDQLNQLQVLADKNLQKYAKLQTILEDGTRVFGFPRVAGKKGKGENFHARISQISLTLNSVFLEIVSLHEETAAGHK